MSEVFDTKSDYFGVLCVVMFFHWKLHCLFGGEFCWFGRDFWFWRILQLAMFFHVFVVNEGFGKFDVILVCKNSKIQYQIAGKRFVVDFIVLAQFA